MLLELIRRALPGLLAAFFVAAFMVFSYRQGEHDAAERLNAKHAAELSSLIEQHATALADAQAKARAIEQQRISDLEKVTNDAQHEIDAARRDAAAAAGVSRSLQQHAQALAAACSSPTRHSSPTLAGQAASAPGLVLADVLSRADERAGELASAYDAARAAGAACERAYSAVRGQ